MPCSHSTFKPRTLPEFLVDRVHKGFNSFTSLFLHLKVLWLLLAVILNQASDPNFWVDRVHIISLLGSMIFLLVWPTDYNPNSDFPIKSKFNVSYTPSMNLLSIVTLFWADPPIGEKPVLLFPLNYLIVCFLCLHGLLCSAAKAIIWTFWEACRRDKSCSR